MPFALILAFAASIGVHALALFAPDVELSTAPEVPPLTAELRPRPPPAPPPKPAAKPPARPHPPALPHSPPHAAGSTATPATPVLSVPGAAESPLESASESATDAAGTAWEPPPPPEIEAVPLEQRLPSRGLIRFRVDRGDQGFEVGSSLHTWEIADGRYRIASSTETSGLVALFKSLRIELESRGRLTPGGLQPEHFAIRRNGRETGERADFDWERMQVRIGDGAPQAMVDGAQDLLSFHYQLGFLPYPAAGNTLPIATGKKFEYYRLEAVGEEDIEVPAGTFHTLHLRAPGSSTTELWLAYDALLLPVKIRYTDRHGDSFVQVATELKYSKED
ncbi:MAG: hypothetical protein BGO63_01550 [Candidatus Accumulibacter sp. 66-26]|nr:DUF3108 domain-containing protein [Accumulibacter sp.]OJW46408.1 MAG: hypothetical protein BGO63_01550 [Candidatus Accumulibacter sp. 66-26]